MKHFTIALLAIIFHATQINAIDYSKEIKDQANQTATTVVGKFEQNAYTLSKEYEKCNNALIPALCYQQVLKKIEDEQAKNSKAARNCFLALFGIGTVKVIVTSLTSAVVSANGVNAIDKSISAIQAPIVASISVLGVDYAALSILESKIREDLKK